MTKRLHSKNTEKFEFLLCWLDRATFEKDAFLHVVTDHIQSAYKNIFQSMGSRVWRKTLKNEVSTYFYNSDSGHRSDEST